MVIVYKPTAAGICVAVVTALSGTGNSHAETYPHESIDDWIMEYIASFLGMEDRGKSQEREYL
jgi:hypothetical protein